MKVHTVITGKLAFAVLLLGLFTIAGQSQDKSADAHGLTEKADNTLPAPYDQKVAVSMSSVSAGPSYLIGVNDVLRISVWKEPDLSATLPVRPDGMVSVPLLNDVLAAGLTPMQLAAILTQKLKRYVAVPRVTVVVAQTNPHRVYVLGEVQHTGSISLLPKMTVLQALATAGFTPFANTKKIYILRTDNGQEQKIPFNYKQVIKGGEAMSQNLLLQPGDTIVVP